MAPNLISMFVAQKILTCILSSIKEKPLRPVEGFLWNWSSWSSWLYSGSSSLLEGITAESNSRAACGCSYNKGRTQWLKMYYRLLNSPGALWHIHRGVQMFVTLVYSETTAHRRVTEEHQFTASSMMNAYMLSPCMLFLSRARQRPCTVGFIYSLSPPPTVGGSHMPRDTYLWGHVSKKWPSCWPIFRIKIFKGNIKSALSPPVQHEVKAATQMQSAQAGWRGQQGFSHTGSAVAALDSTQRLSRCNQTIIRAVLSGDGEWERREGGNAEKKALPSFSFSVCPHILLNIQHFLLYLVPLRSRLLCSHQELIFHTRAAELQVQWSVLAVSHPWICMSLQQHMCFRLWGLQKFTKSPLIIIKV